MIPALKALKEKNVNCHLVYPAHIRILTEDGGTRFCHMPDKHSSFCRNMTEKFAGRGRVRGAPGRTDKGSYPRLINC